jgi:hypothetical protein
MSKRWIIIAWVVGALGVLALLGVLLVALESRRMRRQIYSTVHVGISLGPDAQDVQALDLELCALLHRFNREQLLDTVSENFPTWEHEAHCPVRVSLLGVDGAVRVHVLDSMEHRTSGWHQFTVFADSVSYKYWP